MEIFEILQYVSKEFHAAFGLNSYGAVIHAHQIPELVNIAKKYNIKATELEDIIVFVVENYNGKNVLTSKVNLIPKALATSNRLSREINYSDNRKLIDTLHYLYGANGYIDAKQNLYINKKSISEFHNILLTRFEYACKMHTEQDSAFNQHIRKIKEIHEQIKNLNMEIDRINESGNWKIMSQVQINEE